MKRRWWWFRCTDIVKQTWSWCIFIKTRKIKTQTEIFIAFYVRCCLCCGFNSLAISWNLFFNRIHAIIEVERLIDLLEIYFPTQNIYELLFSECFEWFSAKNCYLLKFKLNDFLTEYYCKHEIALANIVMNTFTDFHWCYA